MSLVMRLMLWFVILACLLALGLLLGDRIQNDAGYALLAYGEYSIEMSIWTACIALIVVAGALWIVFGLSGFLSNVPVKLILLWRSIGLKRADTRLVQGAFWLRQDNPGLALSVLQRDARQESLPALHWLLASEAARRLDLFEESAAYLETAESMMIKVPKQIAPTLMPQTFRGLVRSLKKNWREDWAFQLEIIGDEDALTRLSALNALSNYRSLALEVVLARLALASDLMVEATHHIDRARQLDAQHPLVICLDLESQFGRTPDLELLRTYLLEITN